MPSSRNWRKLASWFVSRKLLASAGSCLSARIVRIGPAARIWLHALTKRKRTLGARICVQFNNPLFKDYLSCVCHLIRKSRLA